MKTSNKLNKSITNVQQGLVGATILVSVATGIISGIGSGYNTLNGFYEDSSKELTEIAVFIPNTIFNSVIGFFKGAFYGGSSMFSFILLAAILELLKPCMNYVIKNYSEE